VSHFSVTENLVLNSTTTHS